MAGPDVEKLLLDRSAGGDRDAYATLYKRYLDPLCKYTFLFTGSRENSQEIVQDVFVRIWEKKERLAKVQSFKPYLFKTAKNLLIDHIRHQRIATQFQKPISENGPEEPDISLIYSQYYRIAQDAISRLPRKRKLIFKLKTQDDLSLDEIARKLAISKPVVKKQLYAATSFVKEYLRKHGEITIGLSLFFLS